MKLSKAELFVSIQPMTIAETRLMGRYTRAQALFARILIMNILIVYLAGKLPHAPLHVPQGIRHAECPA